MTTIAVKDGVLAVDSLVTQNDAAVGEADKARRLADGTVIAWCGEIGLMEVAFGWFEAGADYAAAPEDLRHARGELVAMRADGSIETYHKARRDPCRAPFHAAGSGARFALGAMAGGLSARRAVEAAATLDLFTGGTIVAWEAAAARSGEVVSIA